MANEFDTQTDNNDGTGVGAIFAGIGNAAKNMYNIQMNRALLNMQQEKSDSDVALQHAQADNLEAQGRITGMEADNMRDYINNQKKMQGAQADNQGMMLDSVQSRIQNALNQHLGTLKNIASTPDGQDAIQGYIQQRNQAINPGPPKGMVGGGTNDGSSTVNTIMPGVGANNTSTGQPPYSTSNPPPMSMVGGGTNITPPVNAQPQTNSNGGQPSVAAPGTQPGANGGPSGGVQPTNNQQFQDIGQGKSQDGNLLPPLQSVFSDKSKEPFSTNQWYMSPKGLDVKTPEMIDNENPLHLSSYQQEISTHIPDLLAEGYSSQYIAKQLPEQLQTQMDRIANYKIKLSDASAGFRSSTQFKSAFEGAFLALNPNYDENQFSARNKYMNGLTSTSPTSVGGQRDSLNTLAMHLNELNNQLLVNKNGGVPAANALVNFVNQNLGHPEVNTFNAAKDIFSAEMNRLLSGKAATVSGIKEAVSNLNQNSSSNQLKGVIQTYANMASDKINTLRDDYTQTMNEPENGKILRPAARAALVKILGNDKFKQHDQGGDVQDTNITPNFNNATSGPTKDFSKFWG